MRSVNSMCEHFWGTCSPADDALHPMVTTYSREGTNKVLTPHRLFVSAVFLDIFFDETKTINLNFRSTDCDISPAEKVFFWCFDSNIHSTPRSAVEWIFFAFFCRSSFPPQTKPVLVLVPPLHMLFAPTLNASEEFYGHEIAFVIFDSIFW